MPKACGLVTSWMRWVPMKSWVWPFGERAHGVGVPDFFEQVAGLVHAAVAPRVVA